jgi:predicted O-methyltransferase YrrM
MPRHRDYLDPIFGAENWFKADILFDRIVDLSRGKPGGARFVELGTHLGRAACYLAEAVLAAGIPADLTTVDLFEDPKIETQCRANLAPYVALGMLTIVKSHSAAFASAYPHEPDFVFIDASHAYADVKADIEAWWPKIKPGGTIAGDDFWWRARNSPLWLAHFPVWHAVETSSIGRDYELTVRDSWAIWWKRRP